MIKKRKSILYFDQLQTRKLYSGNNRGIVIRHDKVEHREFELYYIHQHQIDHNLVNKVVVFLL